MKYAIIRPILKRHTRYIWEKVPQGPPDAILGITEAFKADTNKDKINLGVGAYRDNLGKPFVLNCVRKAERELLNDKLDKEYLGITGYKPFVDSAVKLAYGIVDHDLIAACQSISGTGALRLGGEFIYKFYPNKAIYLPNPTWGNHKPIFKSCGLEVKSYNYYDSDNIKLNTKLFQDLKDMPDNSIVLLHACAHNPTGVDPNKEEWEQIHSIMKSKNHLPFFDMAYQGFATGNIDEDAYSLRLFQDFPSLLLSQSFAKNMGLYGERVGCFSIKSESHKIKQAVESQIKIIVRPMYSNPPINGARIAAKVLLNGFEEWKVEVKEMANRIISMRKLLKSNIVENGSSKDWSHITNQIGMFCFTGLSPTQVKSLINDYSIFLTNDGRISMAGVTNDNLKYLAQSIHNVTK